MPVPAIFPAISSVVSSACHDYDGDNCSTYDDNSIPVLMPGATSERKCCPPDSITLNQDMTNASWLLLPDS